MQGRVLLVPIHLDALVLQDDQYVVEPLHDFSILPYYDPKQQRDVNPNRAFISEELGSKPFQNKGFRLRKGIHLHWALPDHLTRTEKGGDSFPGVPNRWLVSRSRNGNPEGQWVIESNYLSRNGKNSGCISYPAFSEDALDPGDSTSSDAPYRFMGRKRSFEDWKNASGPAEGEAFEPALTAVGYGEPTFAAFYPNCHSVFGMHDADMAADTSGLRYDLIGWYDDLQDDIVQAFFRDRNNYQGYEDWLTALQDVFGWTTTAASEPPECLVCYARIIFEPSETASSSVPDPDQPTCVAVGNTGTEALSAHLACQLTPSHQLLVEDQLESLLLLPQLEHLKLDIGPKFLEARHQKGFTAHPAGFRWIVRLQPDSTGSADAEKASRDEQITLPQEIAHQLNALNLLQKEYDKALLDMESMRRQIFSDWYKYMLSCYPPDGDIEKYPDINESQQFILQKGMEPLREKIEKTGVLKLRMGEKNEVAAAAPNETDSPESLASRLAERINILIKQLQDINKLPGEKPYQLRQIEGTRYWEPNDPVILLSGPKSKTTNRHSRDGRLNPDGWLDCTYATIDIQAGNGVTAFMAKDGNNTLQQALPPLDPQKDIGTNVWDSNPWHPLLMEWEVEIFPKEQGNNQLPETKEYAPDFVEQNYQLTENLPDLLSDRTLNTCLKSAMRYSGRSILTPHAGLQLRQKLEEYLKTLLREDILNAFFEATNVAPENRNEDGFYTEAHIADFMTWVKTTGIAWTDIGMGKTDRAYFDRWLTANIIPLGDRHIAKQDILKDFKNAAFDKWPGLLDQFIKPLDALEWKNDQYRHCFHLILMTAVHRWLQNNHYLSQSLGGFNEALLMHKLTLQLPLADPIGFEQYRDFTRQVAAAVGQGNIIAPMPYNDFSPIRNGLMKLHRIRLIDSFGRVQEMANNVNDPDPDVPFHTSEPLKTDLGPFAFLPPRLAQPASLQFRWLSADEGGWEMNDHPATSPICGWLLANFLDQGIMVYDQDGVSLGALVARAAQIWQAPPGKSENLHPGSIANEGLREVVLCLIRRQQADAAFLDRFMTTLESALENIDTANFAAHQAMALLMSRPLAVVRASVKLEVMGMPAVHQGWHDFEQDIRRINRSTDGFTKVKFPVRLGEYRQLNDGLAGYWIETENGFKDDLFHAPQSGESGDPFIATHASSPMTITCAVDDPPCNMTFLMDPRGMVHATSGILPVKAINIPPEQYKKPLEKLQVTFLTAPVLSERNALRLSLPDEPGYDWSWLSYQNSAGWQEIQSYEMIEKEVFVRVLDQQAAFLTWDELLNENVYWLKGMPDRPGTAIIVPKDQRKKPNLDDPELEKRVNIILDVYSTGMKPFETHAAFFGNQTIREGWLKIEKHEDPAGGS